MTLKDFILASVVAIGALGFASGNPARRRRASAATIVYKDTNHFTDNRPGKDSTGRHVGVLWTNVDCGPELLFSFDHPHLLSRPTLINVDLQTAPVREEACVG